MTNVCSNCEYENVEDSKFCKNCGSSLDSGNDNISLEDSSSANQSNELNDTSKENTSSVNQSTNDTNKEKTASTVSSNWVRCPYCSDLIDKNAKKCKYCGEWVKKDPLHVHDTEDDGKSHTLAIVLGYIFCLLGGWLGLIFAIYLLTRDNKDAKLHGKIQIVLFVIVILLVFAVSL